MTSARVRPGARPALVAAACFGIVTGGASPSGVPSRAVAPSDVPVLLVPGWIDTERDLAALRIMLISAGWRADAVAAITFDEPTGSNRAHAQELDSAVRALLERTGARQIDIVAHSMGGLATRWYLATVPDHRVRRAVFLASPHHGTWSAWVAWGDGAREMRPRSAFLDTLNARPAVPADVRAITVRTPVDTHIVPNESAALPGVPDHEVCCPTHAGLLRDRDVFGIVRAFLEEDGPGDPARSP